ncbi:MAG: CPBP family intramembrane glutamic endopeptidase [Candidatus Acidiferrales bacterium]
MASDSIAPAQSRQLIASPWHTLSILAIFAYFAIGQAHPLHAPVAGAAPAATSHSAMIVHYLIIIAEEIGMAYWVWAGVHWRGGSLRDLTGGRWISWRSLALDVVIAIPFWGVWELTAWLVHLAVDRVHATTATPYQAPAGFAEISLWILVSVAAGISEEIVFRGYLQKQFQIATRSVAIAVILQGAIFGLAHTYQGWKQVIVIAALGILYGILAAARRNLRANMIAHAWSDIFEGWLRFV